MFFLFCIDFINTCNFFYFCYLLLHISISTTFMLVVYENILSLCIDGMWNTCVISYMDATRRILYLQLEKSRGSKVSLERFSHVLMNLYIFVVFVRFSQVHDISAMILSFYFKLYVLDILTYNFLLTYYILLQVLGIYVVILSTYFKF
jgi:hypothetical protein